jgi:hypothetical protein
MTYGNEGGENVRYKHKKPIFVLKLKIYVCWSHVFALQKSFVKFLISHP